VRGRLVLIDTSAWIFALRRPPHHLVRDRVDDLLGENRVAILPMISLELLGGRVPAFEKWAGIFASGTPGKEGVGQSSPTCLRIASSGKDYTLHRHPHRCCGLSLRSYPSSCGQPF